MRLCGPIIMLALLLLAGSLCAQDAAALDGDELAQAREAVRAEYAESFDRLGRMTHEERVILAEALLAAARDTQRPTIERFVLADEATAVAAPVGTQVGNDLANQALTLARELGFHTAVTETRRQREIHMGRLATMQSQRRDPAAIAPVARDTIEASLVYCDALIADGQLTEARRMIQYARTLAQRQGIEDMEDAIDARNAYHRWATDREAVFTQSRARLSRAEENGNPTAVEAARIELAELFLSYDGDLAAAGEQLAGMDHPLAGALATWAQVQAGESVSNEALLAAIVGLRSQVARVDAPAKDRIGAEAMALCDQYASQASTPADQVMAELHREQIELLMGNSDTAQLLAQLVAGYRSFGGELMLLDEGQSRVTYDFSDPAQLADWSAEGRGQPPWVVANGVLGQAQAGGSIRHHLRFRADEPLTIQVRGTGIDQVGIMAVYYRWGENNELGTCQYHLRRPAIANHGRDRRQGLELITFGQGHTWGDSDYVMGRNRNYTLRLDFDGAGGVSCWVDDVLVHEYVAAPGDPVFTDGSMSVRLTARTVNPSSPTLYDDLMIVGDLLPAPNFRPTAD